MLPDGRRLGAHLPLGGGMVKAVDRAHEIGAARHPDLRRQPDGVATARRAAGRARPRSATTAEHDIRPIAIHASYLVNLAGPEPDFFERSIEPARERAAAAPGVRRALRQRPHRVASRRGRRGGHPAGRRGRRPMRRRRPAAHRRRPSPTTPRWSCSRTRPAAAFGLGVDLDELAGIATAIAACGVPDERVGFCLDDGPCVGRRHRHASPAAIDAFLAAFDAPDRPRPPGHGAPQRLALGAGLAARPP